MKVENWLLSLSGLRQAARKLSGGSPRRRRNTSASSHAVAQILDARVCLSVDSVIDPVSGALTVTADGSRTIDVDRNDAGHVSVNGTSTEISADDVTELHVIGDVSNNRINLSAVNSTTFPNLTGVSVDGGDGRDYIVGSDFDDSIRGGLANDTIYAGSGDDDLFGDDGDDLVHGGLGDDHLDGGLGANVLDGDDGIDFEEHGFSGDVDEHQVASLTDAGSAATGTARYSQDDDHRNRVTLSVQVQNGTPGVHDITVGGFVVGQVTVDATGSGTVRFSSNPGSSGALLLNSGLPSIHAGVDVQVGTLTGTFGNVVIGGGSSTSSDSETQLRASLNGLTSAYGRAEYSVEYEHGRFESQFEVDLYAAIPGSTYDVSINGSVVGSVTINSRGRGKLEYKDFPHEAGELPFPAGFITPVAADTIDVGGIVSGSLIVRQHD